MIHLKLKLGACCENVEEKVQIFELRCREGKSKAVSDSNKVQIPEKVLPPTSDTDS